MSLCCLFYCQLSILSIVAFCQFSRSKAIHHWCYFCHTHLTSASANSLQFWLLISIITTVRWGFFFSSKVGWCNLWYRYFPWQVFYVIFNMWVWKCLPAWSFRNLLDFKYSSKFLNSLSINIRSFKDDFKRSYCVKCN